jgi:hypothetical protein
VRYPPQSPLDFFYCIEVTILFSLLLLLQIHIHHFILTMGFFTSSIALFVNYHTRKTGRKSSDEVAECQFLMVLTPRLLL